MNLVIDKLVEVLSVAPDPILPSNRLGTKIPSSGGEIPAVSISLNIHEYKGIGIGNFVRSGDSIVQNTAVVEVRPTSETFSGDLKLLRIEPLPLKKNPSSVKRNFTEQDVQIRNVTDLPHPVDYRMVEEPADKEEYSLDVPRARIIFGKAQTEGEKIEVIHWTVTWRDKILGERYSGSMMFEIWANSFNEADEISRRLQTKLKKNPDVLRQKGFLKLQPASLEHTRNTLLDPPIGSTFSVWQQNLGYKFTFEAEEGGELSSGVPIKRIDVDMDDNLNESFSVEK